jgi:hypothetical protein
MSISLPNLTLSFLTICEIITFKVKEKVFSPLQNGNSSLLGSKKTTFSSRYGMCLFGFLFLIELGTCPQNLMPTQGVEPWENHQFPQGSMLKFTYKGRFLTIKIAYEKFLDGKSKWRKHALVPPLHIEIFIFEKHWNLDFWWYFKVLSLTPKGPMSVDGFLGSSDRLSRRQKHERSSEILKEGGPM